MTTITVVTLALGIGANVKLLGTTLAANPSLKGSIIKDVDHPIVLNITGGTMPGVFHERVLKETVAGTLDFYFWIETSKPLQTPSMSVVWQSFDKAFTADVEYRTDGEGLTGPVRAIRSGRGGTLITFVFENVSIGSTPKLRTRETYIKTNAKAVTTGGMTEIDATGNAFTSTSVNTLRPQ